MVKLYLIAALVVVAAVAVSAGPLVPELDEYEPLELAVDEHVPEQGERADRQRRVTCDLLSFGGMVGDSACAANCLSMGKAGGSCSGGVCQCRKTTFKELWDKRFG